jgi:hypothetical protein
MSNGPSHAALVSAAALWLRGSRRHRVVLTEIGTASFEIPDVIGWLGNGFSTVVEIKVSRSDFAADRRKIFRRHPEFGMGYQRWYFVPRGLLDPREVPENFGLAELRGSRVFRLKNPTPFPTRNVRHEMELLISACQRATENFGLKAFGPLQPVEVITDTPRRGRGLQLALMGGR